MFTLTFIAIQIAELLKCMLCHTGDLGSRLDTLDDIETEKNCPYPQIASLLLNSYHKEVLRNYLTKIEVLGKCLFIDNLRLETMKWLSLSMLQFYLIFFLH